MAMSSPPDYAAPLQVKLAKLQASVPAFNPGTINLKLPNVTGGGKVKSPTGKAPSGDFAKFIKAILGQESGRNYKARNASSGAAGAYQIMPGNIPSWSREALGRTVSLNEFMRSPKIQDAIATFKLKQYVKRYGYQGAAAAWYGGPGVAKNWASKTRKQGAYPSIAAYVAQVMRRMGR